MYKKVVIIMLNWNGWNDTIECLESLLTNNYPNFNIIIVDNNSDNDSVEKIKKYAKGEIVVTSPFLQYTPKNKPFTIIELTKEIIKNDENYLNELINKNLLTNIILIKNGENFGFSAGNNVGLSFALKMYNPDFFLVLNNDTVLERNVLCELVEIMNNDKTIGIVGPKIHYYSNPNLLHLNKRYAGILSPIECFISGCCFLVSKEVILKIGLLDSNFFLFFEETDYFMRAKRKGYKTLYVPTKDCVFHKFSPSIKKIKNNSLYHVAKSGMIYFRKHRNLIFLNFFISTLLFSIIINLNYTGLIYFIKGIIDGIKIPIKKIS